MSIFTLKSLAVGHLSSRKGSIRSRGSFIITQKENKGEYNGKDCYAENCTNGTQWCWHDSDIDVHVLDQNGPNGNDGTPYRYLSATDFGNNVCTGDARTTNGKTIYSNINEQISCSANTLNAGNWYSFLAASAGTFTPAGEMPNSICPKGWQLPINSDNKSYDNLIYASYNIPSTTSKDTDLLANSTISFIRSGYYLSTYGSLSGRGANGHYWTSTTYGSNAIRIMRFSSTYFDFHSGANKATGMSIRCVSR